PYSRYSPRALRSDPTRAITILLSHSRNEHIPPASADPPAASTQHLRARAPPRNRPARPTEPAAPPLTTPTRHAVARRPVAPGRQVLRQRQRRASDGTPSAPASANSYP